MTNYKALKMKPIDVVNPDLQVPVICFVAPTLTSVDEVELSTDN